MDLAKAQLIARDLMNFHRLENWQFKFSNAVSFFGYCHWSKKLITLSKNLVEMNPEEKVIETILHEIAHAIAPKYAHHGPDWKKAAVSIGCAPIRCYDNTVARPSKRFIGTCPKCSVTIERHRRKTISCSRCNPKYDETLLFQWSVK